MKPVDRGNPKATVCVLATCLVFGTVRVAAAAPAVGGMPPCAACLAWEGGPDEALALLGHAAPAPNVVVRAPSAAALRVFAGAGTTVTALLPVSEPPDPVVAASLGGVLLDTGALPGTPAERLFAVKEQAVRWRAAAPGAFTIGVEANSADLVAFLHDGLTPYVDVVLPVDDGAVEAPPGIAVWRRMRPRELDVDAILEATRGAERGLVLAPLSGVPGEVIRTLADLREWLPSGLTPLPAVALSCGGPAPCHAEAFLHPVTLEAVAWLRAEAIPARPPLHETALVLSPGRISATRQTGPGGALLRIVGWSGAGEGFASSVDVRDRALPTVEEILARHQAWSARQERRLQTVLSHGSTLLTFRVPGLAAPVTVTAGATLLRSAGVVEMVMTNLRLNGTPVEMGRDGVPRLPLVEPDRAAAAPLALSLDERYTYRLEGLSRVDGHEAYRVSFKPRSDAASLYHGQAWITTGEFALARLEATQTRLMGAIVSSRQEDELAPQVVGGERVWLPRRTEVHQVYEGPGHRTPVHRVLEFAGHAVNAPDHEARRLAAHASREVMLRETSEGWRYLRRAAPLAAEAEAAAEAGAAPPPALRQVAGRSTRVMSLALGALFDPNIDGPLPFAGLSYVDLDFLGTGAQVNALVAGPFLQAAWSVPSLWDTRWQLQGSAFVSLVAYNDRVFEAGLEQYEQNVSQRPARLSLGVLRPGRLRLRAAYELGLTRYSRSDSTASAFAAPASPPVHALRVALEADRGPWTAALWGVAAVRQHWRPWGFGQTTPRSFQRFGVEASRSFVLSPQAVLRMEGAWADGRRLDRFSRFNFDAVDNRLRGYPSAALRYDRGGALRTVATWTVAPQVRASAFLDFARVRDPGQGQQNRNYPGAGAALDLPLPLRSVAALDWGYGFEAPNRDGGRGAHVFRVTVYKLF
jgi:hypothetical protein